MTPHPSSVTLFDACGESSLPHASWVEVPGAGHWSQLEDPDAFAEPVCRFLAGQRNAHAPEQE